MNFQDRIIFQQIKIKYYYCQVDVISRDEHSPAGDTGHGQTLRMRMSPHNIPEMSRVEMLADCPIDHPFFVKDKGKCLSLTITMRQISQAG